jgi:hypothetical protein
MSAAKKLMRKVIREHGMVNREVPDWRPATMKGLLVVAGMSILFFFAAGGMRAQSGWAASVSRAVRSVHPQLHGTARMPSGRSKGTGRVRSHWAMRLMANPRLKTVAKYAPGAAIKERERGGG